MFPNNGKPFRILIADDDADDVQLARECFSKSDLTVEVNDVGDGQLLMDHLYSTIENKNTSTLPHLILLDLNMPRKGGFEALSEIKAHEHLRKIPITIFTTSKTEKEIEKAYELGASCFVTKPDTMEEWYDKLNRLGRFWVECVRVSV
jgi:CheY-like chemotaxis protein